MAIFLVYSTSGITSGEEVYRELKMAAILKILNYWTQLQFDLRYDKIVQIMHKKVFFMMMTSITLQGSLKVGPLYSFINEITTFFKKNFFFNFELLNTASIWPQIWKDRPNYAQKSFFHDDDVDDVTG